MTSAVMARLMQRGINPPGCGLNQMIAGCFGVSARA